jgi:hypothetical protein
MAEAAPDNIASARTVDDLFQILRDRRVPPFEPREQLLKFLRMGELLIDQHIKTLKTSKSLSSTSPSR